MKKSLILFGLVLTATAFAGSIKTWSSGETLRSADLNSNFQHIHNNMVGNHGARLVDADVSATAAIAHSKLATPALVPKAWASVVAVNCDGSLATSNVCTSTGSQITSITSNASAGTFRVNLAYTPTDNIFLTIAQSHVAGIYCTTGSFATTNPNFIVTCRTDAGVAAGATVFSVLVLDNN